MRSNELEIPDLKPNKLVGFGSIEGAFWLSGKIPQPEKVELHFEPWLIDNGDGTLGEAEVRGGPSIEILMPNGSFVHYFCADPQGLPEFYAVWSPHSSWSEYIEADLYYSEDPDYLFEEMQLIAEKLLELLPDDMFIDRLS